jgi:hypothetical protein
MGLTKPRAAQISDIDYKQAVRVVTVANITLAGGAPSLVDGVSLAKNDRVLVTGQGTASQNGIYLVATLGSGSNGTWTRTLDTDVTGELLSGTIVMVTEGNIYADTQWKLITNDPIVIGTTPLSWQQNYSANSITGGNSNVIVYNNSSVALSSAGTSNVLLVNANGIAVTGTASAGGNISTGGNLSVANNALISGDLSVIGNATLSGNILGDRIINGNTSVEIQTPSGNANVSVSGSTNVVVFSSDGVYVTGILSTTGNITVANASVVGNTVTANLNATSLSLGGNVLSNLNVTPNIAAGNMLTPGLISATGNITGGNLLTGGLVSANGNITTDGYFLGNVACASGIYATRIFNASSEVNVGSANGNVNVAIAGSNVTQFASTGQYITGNLIPTTSNLYTLGDGTHYWKSLYVSGNTIYLGNANIGIVGSNLTFNSNVVMTQDTSTGNVVTVGNLSVTGNITSNTYFIGNGAFLTGISGGGGGGGGDSIANAATSLGIPTASGNIIGSIQGVSNIVVMSGNTHFFKGAYSIPQTFTSNLTLVSSYNSLMFGTVTFDDGNWFDIPDGAICVFSETV